MKAYRFPLDLAELERPHVRISEYRNLLELKRYFNHVAKSRQYFFLTLDELQVIARYKLGARFSGWLSRHHNVLTEQLVQTQTRNVFGFTDPNFDRLIAAQIEELTRLPGVGVRLASAVLSISHSKLDLPIGDDRLWEALFPFAQLPSCWTAEHYRIVLIKLRDVRRTLGWESLAELEFAIWNWHRRWNTMPCRR